MTNLEGEEEPLETFGDPQIASGHGGVPLFLWFTYAILPIWGIVTFFYFYNGSHGWWDRGSWRQLQIAANTTFPTDNVNWPEQPSNE